MLTRTDIKQYSTNFEELGSTVVILGSRGHSGIRKFALGSVSSRVAALSSAPSLVVREGVCATPEPPTPGGASSSTAEDRSVTICVGDDVNGAPPGHLVLVQPPAPKRRRDSRPV